MELESAPDQMPSPLVAKLGRSKSTRAKLAVEVPSFVAAPFVSSLLADARSATEVARAALAAVREQWNAPSTSLIEGTRCMVRPADARGRQDRGWWRI